MISVYSPQYRLYDNQEDDFCKSLISAVRKLWEKEIVVIEADLNGHVGRNPEDHEDQHGSYGYGISNKEGERILESQEMHSSRRGQVT